MDFKYLHILETFLAIAFIANRSCLEQNYVDIVMDLPSEEFVQQAH